jgi:hypothetical protein
MRKLILGLILGLIFTVSSVEASEPVKIQNVIVTIEVDQTKVDGATWDSGMMLFGNIKGPDLIGAIMIPKKGCPKINPMSVDLSTPSNGAGPATQLYEENRPNVCMFFDNFAHTENLAYNGHKITDTTNSYQFSIQLGELSLSVGDELYFELLDADIATASDEIGRGILIFSGDRILEGRLGSMVVRVEFIY